MCVLSIDLGGTKLATAIFSEDGSVLCEERLPLEKRKGAAVGSLMAMQVNKFLQLAQHDGNPISSIGISVPGISYQKTGIVWAPNIAGWEAYPLLKEIQATAAGIPVTIDSDRACYILGEAWKGGAQGCDDAIFLAVGTGIGAGILVNGGVLRGWHDIAGAVGWMALEKPFQKNYTACGCFESRASGEGIAKLAKELLCEAKDYNGVLKEKPNDAITAFDVFEAYEQNDRIAMEVAAQCVAFWGMAVANLVSIFNPEKIILGGGVFGPAVQFIPAIYEEAIKWAQPVSIKEVVIEPSVLGNNAGLYGAARLALQNNQK
ncbi:MAG: ROK family protein [Flavisolibacter sp.]